MSRARPLSVAFLFLALAASPSVARSRHGSRAAPQGSAGVFDYYVLSLSWSPEHCVSARADADGEQCSPGRKFGFVVHGLWPQYETGWPESCGAEPLDRAVGDRMLDIMPSPKLIRHEWEKHGTCSGLPASSYFGKIREAFGKVRIPAAFQGPTASVRTTPAGFKRALLDANPGIPQDGVAISCSGRYLQEVHICLAKDLSPCRCGRDVRDHCTAPDIVVRPVR
ncbi:MAG: ribonuclease T2 [Acidobacteriia bacterium]|nr:ribonuclease T2 [Terriglobia bacterium]